MLAHRANSKLCLAHRKEGATGKKELQMQLLRRLLKEAEQVDLSQEIIGLEPVAEGEKVLGTLPHDLKCFWSVIDRRFRELISTCSEKHEQLDVVFGKSRGEVSAGELAIIFDHVLLHNEHEVISSLFWHMVETEFPDSLLNSGVIGVRENWQVVSVPKKERRTIEVLAIPIRL